MGPFTLICAFIICHIDISRRWFDRWNYAAIIADAFYLVAAIYFVREWSLTDS